MIRYLVPFCFLFFAIGFYTSQYDLFEQVTENIKEMMGSTAPVYQNGTTRRGTPCLIVRPEDNPQKLIRVWNDRQVFDDFTKKQLEKKNKTSNSTQTYCYDFMDTDEYKLVSATRNVTSALCYQEVYDFEARDSWKYETKSQYHQIKRDCCEFEGHHKGYASCTMTSLRFGLTEYFHQTELYSLAWHILIVVVVYIGSVVFFTVM